MKAIVVDGDGKAADSLRIAETPDPVAGDEEVLLRVHAKPCCHASLWATTPADLPNTCRGTRRG